MNADDLFSLEELIFQERKCRTCGKIKSLMDDFYVTRKDRGSASSAYSYECKECTIKRVKETRIARRPGYWEYPDW